MNTSAALRRAVISGIQLVHRAASAVAIRLRLHSAPDVPSMLCWRQPPGGPYPICNPSLTGPVHQPHQQPQSGTAWCFPKVLTAAAGVEGLWVHRFLANKPEPHPQPRLGPGCTVRQTCRPWCWRPLSGRRQRPTRCRSTHWGLLAGCARPPLRARASSRSRHPRPCTPRAPGSRRQAQSRTSRGSGP